MRVLVTGGGTAGLAAAVGLSQRGIDVERVERSTSWRTNGAGLTLYPNGERALRSLGLDDAVVDAGFRIEVMRIVHPTGKVIAEVPGERWPAGGTVRGRGPSDTFVTTVGSHDTASAVVAVPAMTERFAYIASGTWSLVGLELAGPLLTHAAREANFTNEGGVDGRIRFLRNVGGLWLLQECLREWRLDLAPLLAEALALPGGGPTFDVDDPVFIPPGGMPERIAGAIGRSLQQAATVRCILDSLAIAYARTIEQVATLTGMPVDVIHVVGGGSQNELLCQLTADRCGLPVIAGPVEATALGNVVVQARTHGVAPASLEALRSLIATSCRLRRYEPS